jgi:hypothetical protein
MRRSHCSVCVLGLFVLVGGCGGKNTGSPTERLWVSGVPKNPKAPITAFITARTTGDKFIGSFFSGSMLRGGHDVFEWRNEGDDAAVLRFLQDGSSNRVRIETCKPTTGFDYCIIMHGDPTRTERYQSRKRWTVRRPGKRREAGAPSVMEVMFELSEDDPDLSAALDLVTGPRAE